MTATLFTNVNSSSELGIVVLRAPKATSGSQGIYECTGCPRSKITATENINPKNKPEDLMFERCQQAFNH